MTITSILQTFFLVFVFVLIAVTFYTDMELSMQYFKATAKAGKIIYSKVYDYTNELVQIKEVDTDETKFT